MRRSPSTPQRRSATPWPQSAGAPEIETAPTPRATAASSRAARGATPRPGRLRVRVDPALQPHLQRAIETAPQRLPPARQLTLRRAFIDAEKRRDFPMGISLDIVEHDNRAIARR